MSEDNKGVRKSGVNIFLSGRDLAVVVAFLIGIPVGGFTWVSQSAGTPSETTQAVVAQTDTLSMQLGAIKVQLTQLASATEGNSEAIIKSSNAANDRMDSLYSRTMGS